VVQLQATPFANFEVNVAYRLIDARMTTGGTLQQRALISPQRVLTTLSYAIEERSWQIDATLVWNGSGRIPSTLINPDSLRLNGTFDSYFRANAQITKRFSNLDFYIGMENITNFIQQKAIVSSLDPHSQYFDASLIWGPLDSRFVYAGIRWRVE
jgi:hypothetical protein